MEPLMKPEEAAKKLGLARRSLVRLVREKRISHYRLGRNTIRFCDKQLEEYCKAINPPTTEE